MSDLAPITVFFDTEFSSLDENFRELISIGMASEASEDKMYLVLKEGWQGAGVSDFVRDVVLPLMPLHQPEYCSRSGTAARIEEFFDQLRGGDIATPVLLLSDSPIDWTLLVDLFEKDWPAAKNTTWRLIDSELQAINKNPEYEFALEAYFQDRAHRLMKRGGERHHPLVDAMAMRHAFALAGDKKAYGSNSPPKGGFAMINETERLERRRWIDHNRTSSGIEGIRPDAATIAIEEAYVRGELTPDQYSDALAKMLGVKPYDHDALRALVKRCERGEISVDEMMAQYDVLTTSVPEDKGFTGSVKS